MQARVVRMGWYGLGILLMVHSMGSTALAGVNSSVPEIDGSAVAAGVGLLAAGVLLVRARKRR